MTTFSLTKAFTSLLHSLEGASRSDDFARVCATGHLSTCPNNGPTPCFWCAAATMTPEVVAATALWNSMTDAVNSPISSWPSAIRARMAIYDLAELPAPTGTQALRFTGEFFALVHDLGRRLERHLRSQGEKESDLEHSARLAAAITALPRMLTSPHLAPKDQGFQTRLQAISSTKNLDLETMAILTTEQRLAGQFMEYGRNGRALADLAGYLGDPQVSPFQDLAWVASFYARRDQLVALAEELIELEAPTIKVVIPEVTQHYRLSALQTLVLRAQPIDWATTFIHTTGGAGWKNSDGDGYLVTPSVALALHVWKDRHCASAIGITEETP